MGEGLFIRHRDEWFKFRDVEADGNCMYYCLAECPATPLDNVDAIRNVLAKVMKNPSKTLLNFFVEYHKTDADPEPSVKKWQEKVLQDSEWGSNFESSLFGAIYGIDVRIVSNTPAGMEESDTRTLLEMYEVDHEKIIPKDAPTFYLYLHKHLLPHHPTKKPNHFAILEPIDYEPPEGSNVFEHPAECGNETGTNSTDPNSGEDSSGGNSPSKSSMPPLKKPTRRSLDTKEIFIQSADEQRQRRRSSVEMSAISNVLSDIATYDRADMPKRGSRRVSMHPENLKDRQKWGSVMSEFSQSMPAIEYDEEEEEENASDAPRRGSADPSSQERRPVPNKLQQRVVRPNNRVVEGDKMRPERRKGPVGRNGELPRDHREPPPPHVRRRESYRPQHDGSRNPSSQVGHDTTHRDRRESTREPQLSRAASDQHGPRRESIRDPHLSRAAFGQHGPRRESIREPHLSRAASDQHGPRRESIREPHLSRATFDQHGPRRESIREPHVSRAASDQHGPRRESIRDPHLSRAAPDQHGSRRESIRDPHLPRAAFGQHGPRRESIREPHLSRAAADQHGRRQREIHESSSDMRRRESSIREKEGARRSEEKRRVEGGDPRSRDSDYHEGARESRRMSRAVVSEAPGTLEIPMEIGVDFAKESRRVAKASGESGKAVGANSDVGAYRSRRDDRTEPVGEVRKMARAPGTRVAPTEIPHERSDGMSTNSSSSRHKGRPDNDTTRSDRSGKHQNGINFDHNERTDRSSRSSMSTKSKDREHISSMPKKSKGKDALDMVQHSPKAPETKMRRRDDMGVVHEKERRPSERNPHLSTTKRVTTSAPHGSDQPRTVRESRSHGTREANPKRRPQQRPDDRPENQSSRSFGRSTTSGWAAQIEEQKMAESVRSEPVRPSQYGASWKESDEDRQQGRKRTTRMGYFEAE